MFVPVRYSYTSNILIITSRRVRYIYEVIMGNKHEVLWSKAKLWGPQPPEAIGGPGAVFGDFCIF